VSPAGGAALTLAVLLLGGCAYRLARPPVLGEDVRVVVVANDARLVRSQAALQGAVAKLLTDQLGWRVSPVGSARLELTLAEESITHTAIDGRNIPIRWSIRMQGTATLHSRRGPITTSWAATGFVNALSDEPDAINQAAGIAARDIATWLEFAGQAW